MEHFGNAVSLTRLPGPDGSSIDAACLRVGLDQPEEKRYIRRSYSSFGFPGFQDLQFAQTSKNRKEKKFSKKWLPPPSIDSGIDQRAEFEFMALLGVMNPAPIDTLLADLTSSIFGVACASQKDGNNDLRRP